MKFQKQEFSSSRSVVVNRRGMVASSQPLAVEAAIETLRLGGNAIDAGVTANFVLNVVEPMSTGIGGDCFAIIYLAREKRLIGVNGTGRAPADISSEALIERGLNRMPVEGPLSVTVPGALDALAKCLKDYGTISLREALARAISHAEEGFLVTEVVARQWKSATSKLNLNSESARVYLPGGKAPAVGQVFRNPDLEKTLRTISEQGTDAFYRGGKIAESLVSGVRALKGFLSLSDLAEHSSDVVSPIKCLYRDQYEIVEMPPNSQGIATLIGLNILDGLAVSEMAHGSAEYLHNFIRVLTLALAEGHKNVGDPIDATQINELLSQTHAQNLRDRIQSGDPVNWVRLNETHGDTVFVAAVDEQRNVVSIMSSLYKSFGSGITVPGTGLLLQNRGAGFTLEPNMLNTLRPRKRPYHTLMPAMILREGKPWASLGVVGGMMQPQGQLQVISNLIDYEMNPQSALDAPRFRILDDFTIALEDQSSDGVIRQLQSLGHRIKANTSEEEFGGGQLILIGDERLYGGSDKRKDGCAIGY